MQVSVHYDDEVPEGDDLHVTGSRVRDTYRGVTEIAYLPDEERLDLSATADDSNVRASHRVDIADAKQVTITEDD